MADAGRQYRAFPGASNPTGGTCDLPGIDVITVGSDGIISVVSYFMVRIASGAQSAQCECGGEIAVASYI
ncbi:MAG: hypothetical protein ACRDRG_13230 [Pseudonocardiaceae bacterium]